MPVKDSSAEAFEVTELPDSQESEINGQTVIDGYGLVAEDAGQDGGEKYSQDELFEKIRQSIVDGDAEKTMHYVRLALEADINLESLISDVLVDSMNSVGKDFRNGDFFVPDVLMSSRALDAALYVLDDAGAFKLIQKERHKEGESVLIGTVAGDLHDIGKNIAGLLLRCEGYKVIDLGIDVGPAAFAKAVKENKPQVMGLSALLTTTVGEMKAIIDELSKENVRDDVRVYVSGAPVTQEFADSIGADHYCPDARDTVDYVASVMEEFRKRAEEQSQ